jgi:hypothetical protein
MGVLILILVAYVIGGMLTYGYLYDKDSANKTNVGVGCIWPMYWIIEMAAYIGQTMVEIPEAIVDAINNRRVRLKADELKTDEKESK